MSGPLGHMRGSGPPARALMSAGTGLGVGAWTAYLVAKPFCKCAHWDLYGVDKDGQGEVEEHLRDKQKPW